MSLKKIFQTSSPAFYPITLTDPQQEAGKRKHPSVSEKERIVSESYKSSLSIDSFCLQYGISRTSFYKWRRDFSKGTLLANHSTSVKSPQISLSSPSQIEVSFGSLSVKLPESAKDSLRETISLILDKTSF